MTIQYKGQPVRLTWEYFTEYTSGRESSQVYTFVYLAGEMATKVTGRLTGKQIKKLLGV